MTGRISHSHIGKRLLVCEQWGSEEYPREVVVVEVSPAGRVKLRWGSGVELWDPKDKWRVLEMLPEHKP